MYNPQDNGRNHTTTAATLTGNSREQFVFSPEDLLRMLRRRLWVILLVAVTLTGLAVGFSLAWPPTYEASVKILIGQQRTDNAPSTLGSDVQGLQQLTVTMSEAVNTLPVASAVIQRLDLQQSPKDFMRNLSAQQIKTTQFIEVSYKDHNPERAQQVVNTVGDVFSERVSKVSASTNAITATVWERAAVPDSPVSPNPLRDGALAFLLGSILGIGIALLLEHQDDHWKSPEEVEQVSGVPTFGVIPNLSAARKKTYKSYY